MLRSPLSHTSQPGTLRPLAASPAAVSEADAASFQALRSRLFGIAYRVLGSSADADDVVQDTWLRWHGADRRTVRDPAAFLATVATRLAINVTQSARARRESGRLAAEPADVADDPTLEAERGEALADAIHLLSERLTPAERAAFVLRVAFDYPYRRIADVTGLSEANARQLVTRARGHLADDRRRPVAAAQGEGLLDAFQAAAQTGDLRTLERTLAAEIALPREVRSDPLGLDPLSPIVAPDRRWFRPAHGHA
jgi:RNA polymerase sigma-70 factor (ECF subfamily)